MIRDTYGTKLKVYKTDIPRSVRAEEISAEGKSIFAQNGESRNRVKRVNLSKFTLLACLCEYKNTAILLMHLEWHYNV